MKIVHTEASCGWGGQEIRILEESLGMIERGHEVIVLCPPEARIYEEAGKRGVPVEALPIGRKNLRGLMSMRRWLGMHAVDVVNTHSSTDSWLTALACATLAKAPAVVRTRHISAPVNKSAGTRWLYTRATRHVATTGEALRQTLANDNGFPLSQMTSVPTGIDTRKFVPGEKRAARLSLGLNPDTHYMGIVATLRSWKGHQYLLDAFASFDRSDWHLLIVGDGPQREALEARVNALGLGERVRFAGQCSNPEVWMQALDLFCLPSYANEGVPQAILQAMLTGLPIVTTPVGAITEAVQHESSALVVPPQNAAALCAALTTLADDPVRAAELGRTARERAERNFSRESMLDKMEAIFQQAIAT